MSIGLPAHINGVRIGFRTGRLVIRPDLPCLVLIHGTGGSYRSWNNQLKPLSEFMNVLALDLPGHGQTPGPPLPTVAGYTNWVGSVLDAWDLPGPVVLGGQSLGGAVALEAGLSLAGRLDGLVVIGSGARLKVNPLIFDVLSSDFPAAVDLIFQWSFTKNADPRMVQKAKEAFAQNQPEHIINDLRACDAFDRREDLGRIVPPALIVCGREEKMMPPKYSEYLVEKMPNATLEIIEGAGHQIMEERPEELNQAIIRFMSGIHKSR